MREATVATPLFIDFLGYLERQGHSSADVCRAADLDPRWFDNPNSRLPASAMERLWAAGERLTGNPDLGLHTGASYNPGALGIVGYAVLSCRTAREALDRLSRYAALLNEGLQVQVIEENDNTHVQFGADDRFESFLHRTPRQVMETLASGVVTTLNRLSNMTLEPTLVTFRHGAPASTTAHTRVLGATVRFAQPENRVIYRSAALQANLLSADPALLLMFEGDARRRLEQLESRGGVSGRVLHLLGEKLKGEVPSLATVASELAMSERSIQRALGEEATSFRQLVDEVRKELALEHLGRPGASAADVAFLLGFSEPSAFTRAFRRWTGSSPTQFRSA